MSARIGRFLPSSFFGLSDDYVARILSNTHQFWKLIASRSGNPHHARIIIARERPDFQRHIQFLNTKRARLSRNDVGVWGGLTEQIRYFENMQNTDLFQPYVYLILFNDSEPETTFQSFAAATGMKLLSSENVRLPSMLDSNHAWEKERAILCQKGVWRIYAITDFTGTHDIYYPVLNLMQNASFQFELSFDIVSEPPARALQKLSILYNQAMGDLLSSKGALSQERLNTRFEYIRALRQQIEEGAETLHYVHGAIAIYAKTLEELEEKHKELAGFLNGRYIFSSVPGMQRKLMQYFTVLEQPVKPDDSGRNLVTSALVFSNMVGNGAPAGGGEQGLWYGNSLLNNHPILHNWWGEKGNEAGHSLVLGATGSGKTVFLQAMAWRHIQVGIPVVVLEPRGHFRRLHQILGEKHSSYNEMSFEAGYSINLFDVIFQNTNEQASHVIAALSLLLARDFNEIERAVLLNEIIRQYKTNEIPTLETLYYGLASRHWVEHQDSFMRDAASRIASLIKTLVLDTELMHIFGGVTSQFDIKINQSLTVYDFERVPSAFKGLLYYIILAGITHKCMERRTPRLIIVDEYYLMSQIPSLSESMALMFKTFRTYGAAVWVAEQDLSTLLGKKTDTQHNHYLASNAANTIAFHHTLKDDASALIQQFFGSDSEHLLPFLVGEKVPGRGLIRLAGKIYPFIFVLTPLEEKNLVGS